MRDSSRPNHGNAVTWDDYLQLGQVNEWQFSDPSKENFRCFRSLKDFESYASENFSSSDTAKLFIDPGKYRATNDLVSSTVEFTVNTTVYVKESNLMLSRSSFVDNSSPNAIYLWTPVALNVGFTVMHNASNMGLMGNLYKRGFYNNQLGYEANTLTDYNNLIEIPEHAALISGFNANTELKGFGVSATTNQDITF